MRLQILAVLLCLVLLTGCKSKAPEQVGPSEPQPEIIIVAEQEDAPPQTIEYPVTLTKQFFNPQSLDVKKGDTVVLVIKSADIDHNVAVPQYGVSAPVAFGETQTVSFVTDRTGPIRVECDDKCNPNVVFTVNVN
jgi:plastocyanin